MKAVLILALERVRADLAEALLAAQRDDIPAVESALEAATERMTAAAEEMRAAA